MNEVKLPLLLSSMLLAPAAWTQNVPDGPIADLEAQVTDLSGRISALEAAAPTASVEGRTYCFVLDLTVMRGLGINQTEHLATSIIRRTATFEGGLFEGNLLSHARNTQRDDGTVTPSVESSPDPIYGTYTQNGNRLDVVLDNGTSASWYVSKDGSMISGTSIRSEGPIFGDVMLTVGRTRNYTLVESDNCLAELM